MNLSESDTTQITTMISQERLAPLIKMTGDVQAAIDIHQEILRLGTLLMPVTATIEIALRNMVCDCLSTHFGVDDWLQCPPEPFKWRQLSSQIPKAKKNAQRAEYAKKSQAEKHALDAIAFPNGRPPNLTRENRSKKRQSEIIVSNGKVIAQLTMYFWKTMYSSEYEEALWKTALKRTFPDKKLKRSDISLHLETIYQTRNRLSHHEPVYGWRMSKVLKAIDFVINNLGATNDEGERSLAKLLAADLENLSNHNQTLEDRIASYKD